ncbi:MAG: HAD family hydrolase [Actinomycetota bacterium]
MWELLACDLDGTLLSDHGEVSALTAATLDAVLSNGIAIVPATARRPATTLGLVPWCEYAVCCNGSLVIDRHRNVLDEHVVSSAVVKQIISWVRSVNESIGFAVSARDALAGDRHFEQTRPHALGTWITIDENDLDSFAVNNLSLRSAELGADELAELIAAEFGANTVAVQASSPTTVDVTPTGCSKATGLALICEELGVDPGKVVAFGDSANDADMLGGAGLGLAVNEGHPSAQHEADQLVDRSPVDGIATHIQAVLLDLSNERFH